MVGGQAVAQPVAHQSQFPYVIALPDGFRPEGISAGRGAMFYVGSLFDGAIYRGDVRSGDGSVFIAGRNRPRV